jgi:hypothetical protein
MGAALPTGADDWRLRWAEVDFFIRIFTQIRADFLKPFFIR